MAESIEKMMQQGLISARAAKRGGLLKAQRGTKSERSRMADFDGKEGLRDQGGVQDRGDALGGKDHINRKANTRADSPIGAKPSKGGQAGREYQPGTDEINEGENQRPTFPRSADRARKSNDVKTPKRARGPVGQSGPEYGGPNSRRYG